MIVVSGGSDVDIGVKEVEKGGSETYDERGVNGGKVDTLNGGEDANSSSRVFVDRSSSSSIVELVFILNGFSVLRYKNES